MLIVLLFSFLGGIVSALTPCVLPILPILLASTATQGRWRTIGVFIGLILNFTFLTLFLPSFLQFFHFSRDFLRHIAIGFLLLFGLMMLFPYIQHIGERAVSRLTARLGMRLYKAPHGFLGGVMIGAILGLLWTPCTGPILATVMTLAMMSRVTLEVFFITVSYICGSALVFLGFVYGGRQVVSLIIRLRSQHALITRIFGGIIVGMAFIMFWGLDRKFQEFLIYIFPSWDISPFASFESTEFILQELEKLDTSAF